jgi:hypothetical protein
MSSRALGGVLVLVSVALGAGPAISTAKADVVSGQPDETIQQAYPIAPGHTYSGAFDDSMYEDVDYLAFTVTKANQTFQFTVANTTQTCNDPNDAGCPVYATLMDSNNQQVGGDTSDAGTIATNGDTEVLSWTFASPGTYYLLMESDSDLTPGSPSYTVAFGAPAPGSPAGTGPSAPLVRSLTVPPRQRGIRVRARVVLGQSHVRLNANLVAGHHTVVARLTRQGLGPGAHPLVLRLPHAYQMRLKRKHHLSLVFRLVATSASGQRTSLSRHVTLSG